MSFYQFSLCRLRVTRAAAVMSWVELGSAGADEGPAVLCESVQDIVQVECALSDHLQGLAGGSGRRWPERLQRLGPGPDGVLESPQHRHGLDPGRDGPLAKVDVVVQ